MTEEKEDDFIEEDDEEEEQERETMLVEEHEIRMKGALAVLFLAATGCLVVGFLFGHSIAMSTNINNCLNETLEEHLCADANYKPTIACCPQGSEISCKALPSLNFT